MNKWHLLFGPLAAGLVCAGCGKHQEPAAAPPPAPTAAVNGAEQQTPGGGTGPTTLQTKTTIQQSQAPASVAAAPSAPVNANTANSDAALAALTQAVRKFGFEKRRMPSSVQEVIAAGYVSPVPQPPAGKKFVLDTKNVQVVLE